MPCCRCKLSFFFHQFTSEVARHEYIINDALYGTVQYPTMTRILRCYNGYPRFLEYLSYGDPVLHPRVQTSGAGDDGCQHLEGHPGGRAGRRKFRAGHNELQQRHHRGHTERQRVERPGDNLHEPAGFRGRFGDAAAGRRGGFPRRGLPLRQGARRGPQERRDRRQQLRPSGIRDRELQRAEPGVRESRQLKRRIRCAKSKKRKKTRRRREGRDPPPEDRRPRRRDRHRDAISSETKTRDTSPHVGDSPRRKLRISPLSPLPSW